MKKPWKVSIFLIILLFLSAAFASCVNEEKKFEITLVDSMDGSVIETLEVVDGEVFYRKGTFQKGIDGIDNPLRKEWFFDDWYLDAACATKVIAEKGRSYTPTGDVTFFAGWTDLVEFPFNSGNPTYEIELFRQLFEIEIHFEWIGDSVTNVGKLYGKILPRGDFTGAFSSDVIEIQINYVWIDESVIGDFKVDDAVASVSVREIYLNKSDGFSIPEFSMRVDMDFYNTDPIFAGTKCMLNPHIIVYPQRNGENYVFSKLQYRHAES